MQGSFQFAAFAGAAGEQFISLFFLRFAMSRFFEASFLLVFLSWPNRHQNGTKNDPKSKPTMKRPKKHDVEKYTCHSAEPPTPLKGFAH